MERKGNFPSAIWEEQMQNTLTKWVNGYICFIFHDESGQCVFLCPWSVQSEIFPDTDEAQEEVSFHKLSLLFWNKLVFSLLWDHDELRFVCYRTHFPVWGLPTKIQYIMSCTCVSMSLTYESYLLTCWGPIKKVGGTSPWFPILIRHQHIFCQKEQKGRTSSTPIIAHSLWDTYN